MIDPVTLTGATAQASAIATRGAEQATKTDFVDWLQQQVNVANTEIIRADDGVRRLALGETDNLHQVMIQLERAKLSFELVVQVRNKLLDAYQDILRMQV
jgi:flagellar hook-basal body complex protein FliE